MSSSASSNSTEIVINVLFGLIAAIIGGVTVWQGHKTWKMWREYAHDQGSTARDIELDLQSIQSMPTSLNVLEHEEVVASSASLTTQIEELVESDDMSVSVQHLENQPTPALVINDETSSNPVLIQGAQMDSNELPRVRTDNAQPAWTDLQRGELPHAANDHV